MLAAFAFQLDLDVVAHVRHDRALGVLDLADEIEPRAVGAAMPGQFNFRAGNLDHQRDKVAVARQAEIIELHRQIHVRDGIAQHQGLRELPLLVAFAEFVELFAGVVSLPVIELGDAGGDRAVIHRNLDPAEVAVQRGVGRIVADDVVAGHVLLRLDNAHGKIVVVEQRLAAGVRGQRVERFLLILEIAGQRARGASRVHALGRRAIPWSRRPAEPAPPGRGRRSDKKIRWREWRR